MPNDTDLHKYAGQGDLDKFKTAFPELEIDINTHGASERTILIKGVQSKKPEMVEMLLEEFKADPHAADQYKNTPMHYAAQLNFGDAIQLLAKYGGDINAQNNKGETPLHKAAFGGSVDAARVLKGMPGIKMDLADKSGQTAYQYAKVLAADKLKSTDGHRAVVKVLKSTGGSSEGCSTSCAACACAPLYALSYLAQCRCFVGCFSPASNNENTVIKLNSDRSCCPNTCNPFWCCCPGSNRFNHGLSN